MHPISSREKLILSGLFLSKFDFAGLKLLGFEGFNEAYNVIGFALRGSPASIKNYRDEFDPHFPNSRKGWHRRPLRPHGAKIMAEYENLDIQAFSLLIKSFFEYDHILASEPEDRADNNESPFSRRLVTGIAAENYFEKNHSYITEFNGYVAENTTRYGCGYDFRLHRKEDSNYIAVEVKGLSEKSGSITFTQKEHIVAEKMKDRFYLFVVKNFRESPFHEIYQNPLTNSLTFQRQERAIIQVSWTAGV